MARSWDDETEDEYIDRIVSSGPWPPSSPKQLGGFAIMVLLMVFLVARADRAFSLSSSTAHILVAALSAVAAIVCVVVWRTALGDRVRPSLLRGTYKVTHIPAVLKGHEAAARATPRSYAPRRPSGASMVLRAIGAVALVAFPIAEATGLSAGAWTVVFLVVAAVVLALLAVLWFTGVGRRLAGSTILWAARRRQSGVGGSSRIKR